MLSNNLSYIKNQLARQLGYLRRSAQLFDLGYRDEGIRIATSLRVFFHDRPRDKKDQGSLIKLLGHPDIRLRTTCKPFTPCAKTFSYDGYLHLPGNTLQWPEYLNGEAIFVSVEQWWNQVIFVIRGVPITRRLLALSAAEKDGGAHVDGKLNEDYEAVLSMWSTVHMDEHSAAHGIVPDQHLLALRRFALELSASDELLTLAPAPPSEENNSRIICFPKSGGPILDRALDIAHYYGLSLGATREARQANTPLLERAATLGNDILRPFLLWLGEIYINDGRLEDALIAYSQILAVSPENPDALYGRGSALQRAGNFFEAEADFRLAMERNPSHIRSIGGLANIYVHLERYDSALPLYESALELAAINSSEDLIHETVALQNSKGFALINLAKIHWLDEINRHSFLERALTALNSALLNCLPKRRPVVLANLGYALFLAENITQAQTITIESLKLGGMPIFNGQLEDATRNRVEALDSKYELFIKELWSVLK